MSIAVDQREFRKTYNAHQCSPDVESVQLLPPWIHLAHNELTVAYRWFNVAEGAALWGIGSPPPSHRFCPRHYGVPGTGPFNPALDQEEDIFIDPDHGKRVAGRVNRMNLGLRRHTLWNSSTVKGSPCTDLSVSTALMQSKLLARRVILVCTSCLYMYILFTHILCRRRGSLSHPV